MDKPFREPKLALNRIYTRTGDRGQTGLVGGQRVPKDALRIECYGTIDELNSHAFPSRIRPRVQLRNPVELSRSTEALSGLPADIGDAGAHRILGEHF